MKRNMKYIYLFFLFATNAFGEIQIPKDVYKKVPFSSEFIEDGALIRNINYEAVEAIVPQLNSLYGVKLETRGEAHITVITPPEAQGWFTDHKGINYFISSIELHHKYFKTLQDTKFEIVCVGMRENETNKVFYLVVDSPELFAVRAEIAQELERRASFTGKKTFFDPNKYYPHITIGFEGGDVHGVSKGAETCVQDIKFF
ncbi:MAG: hypothetical protein CMJ16_08315 [Peredibacter sp.]|nr:hypothetical protein [Peredibacter sp.]|tara:strand:- start:4365 stop:4967 length:603 start_codon:yes stop_codon:yes gene_type:complete